MSVPRRFYFLVFAFTCPLIFGACKYCSKKVPCPGYEDALLDAWFPYQNGQTLIFKSSLNSSDTFALDLTDSTVAYEYSSGYGGGTGGCNASKSFNSLKRDTSNYPAFTISFNIGTDSYSTSKSRTVFIGLYRKFFSGQNLSDNGFSSFSLGDQPNIIPQTLTNYSLNGTTYATAQSVIADTALDRRAGVYKIVYAKKTVSLLTKPIQALFFG
jgi:hypothetical protein